MKPLIAASVAIMILPVVALPRQTDSVLSVNTLDPQLTMEAIPRPYTYNAPAFPRTFANNTIALFSRTNIAPLVLGSGLTLIARGLDDAASDAITGQINGVGAVGQSMGDRFVFTGAMATAFAAGQLAPDGPFRRVTFDLAQGFGLNMLVVGVMKHSVRRERPDSSSSLSFPSGHASNFAAAATILARHFGPRVGIPAALVASFVGISRVEHNKHFLSDVVAGGVVGYIVGRTVTAHLFRGEVAKPRTGVSLYPAPGGLGLNVWHAF